MRQTGLLSTSPSIPNVLNGVEVRAVCAPHLSNRVCLTGNIQLFRMYLCMLQHTGKRKRGQTLKISPRLLPYQMLSLALCILVGSVRMPVRLTGGVACCISPENEFSLLLVCLWLALDHASHNVQLLACVHLLSHGNLKMDDFYIFCTSVL